MKAKPPSKPKTHLHQEEKPQSTTTTTTTPSEFSFAIARMAVSQICKSVGYKSIQVSALDTLTLVATKYLQAIAKSASSYSNTSNRTQSNLFDLTLALQDLVSLHTCTLFTTGGIIRDLANFVSFHDEIPFAKPIPRPRRSIPLWNSTGSSSSSSSSHVPQWLPMFPDVNNNSSVNERKCGESLWEDSVLAGGGKIETESVSNGKKGKLELDLGGVEREKVRFRIRAKGLRRNNHNHENKNNTNNNDAIAMVNVVDDQSNGIDDGDQKKKKKSGFKRRRR